MAIFTNQATLVYNGGSANSNIAIGEILEVLSADKTAVEGTYAPGELVTYVITIRNTGTAAFTNLTVTDDLGGGVNAPLTYETGTALYFVNGVLQAAPAVTSSPTPSPSPAAGSPPPSPPPRRSTPPWVPTFPLPRPSPPPRWRTTAGSPTPS